MNKIIILVCLLTGCVATQPNYNKIPLTQGDMPYRLPPGKYIDDRGYLHIEKDYRWSLSEEDLFNDTRNIGKKK
jgi:hypothetical protein